MPLKIDHDYSNSLNKDCYTPGRENHDVLLLVCHNTAGPHDDNSPNHDPVDAKRLSDAAARYLTSNDRQASIHWLVGAEACNAPIYRIVPETSIAYHCGGTLPDFPSSWKNPDDGRIYGRYGLNQVSIGIEVFGHEPMGDVGPKQKAQLKILVKDIVRRYPILKRDGHIVAHALLEGDRKDGKNWVADALKWAREDSDGDCIELSYKVIVPKGQATVRSGPGRTFDIIGSIDADPDKKYQVDCEKHGELINGDDVWSHLIDFKGFVTRSALQISELD